MIDPNKWPDTLKDAHPSNFAVTREELLADNTVKSPENYVNLIIKDWMESITSELERGVKPESWKQYPSHFGHYLVYSNDQFPRTIPIGYVLVCFFRTVYPTTPKIKDVLKIFNYWLQYKDVRILLFKELERDRFYIEPSHVDWYKESMDFYRNPEPDGMDKAKILYGVQQTSIFGSHNK